MFLYVILHQYTDDIQYLGYAMSKFSILRRITFLLAHFTIARSSAESSQHEIIYWI